ncbi:MAG: S8 family serine peptidase, partial [Verrucomicrobiales bacterium]|nr:S8 family serine peptidase [Verrucomicrobiales bacterium]
MAAETPSVAMGRHRVHPTRILARYADHAVPVAKPSAIERQGWIVRREFPRLPGLVMLEAAARRVQVQSVDPRQNPKAGELLQRIDELRVTGLFDYVEPDYIVHALAAPNDTAFTDGTLWALRNLGQSGGVAGADIGASRAWDITTGSTNVIVAIIDSGIRYTHNDLDAQMWRNPGEIADNGRDDDGNGLEDDVFGLNAITNSGDPMDDNDHGTHVAGTIGAAANDGHPHVGVAWNVRLMACKFLDAEGSGTTSDAIQCIDYAVAHGARILNNSWGGGPFSQALFDAIARARDQGVLFVAAAGNEANNNDASPSYPASYQLDNVIAAAAVDRANNLASFSNFGRNTVHLAAPGVSIFSTTSGADNEYKTLSGTSMAAPHVSGAAALLLAQVPGVGLTELRQRLLESTSPLPLLQNRVRSGGRVNAFNALTITPDGVPEVDVRSASGTILTAGSLTPIFVKVTDLFPVTNATVNGTVPGLPNLLFSNDGVSPDSVKDDDTYSAVVSVAPNQSALTLTVTVTAPGKADATRSITFMVEKPPANDAFASRTLIDPASDPVTGTNRKATHESGEPNPTRTGSGRSVWWSWTARAAGIATVSTTGSDFDTVLAVYTGTSLRGLRVVAASDDVQFGVPTSEVIFQAVAGQTYQIAVDGSLGDTGDIVLTASLSAAITNDSFESRTPLQGEDVTLAASNLGARRQSGEPNHAGLLANKSVWWSWTALDDGPTIVSTAGSTFDTVLAVYTGGSFGELAEVASNDDILDSLITTSEVRFDAVRGTTYQIGVDGVRNSFNGDVGNISLSIVHPASNDDFANRIPLTGQFVETTEHNLGATNEAYESNYAGDPGGQSVWWSWTAPDNG